MGLPVEPVSGGGGAGVEALAERNVMIPAAAAIATATITASLPALESVTAVYP